MIWDVHIFVFFSSLNVLAIRRYIVADIRGNESESEEDFPMDDLDNEGFMPLSYQKLVSTVLLKLAV